MHSRRNLAQTTISRLQTCASNIWPVWRDSVKAEIRFRPISKNEAHKIYYRARKWDQETHTAGKHGGIIGRTALTVLQVIIMDFLNFRTGRLDPSILAIAKKASMSERSVHTALKRLKSLNIIDWQRRCEEAIDAVGRFLLRQRTNAYQLLSLKSWLPGYLADPPAPTADTLGYPEPYRGSLDMAAAALRDGDPASVLKLLGEDELDPLAIALAKLGAAISAA